MDAHQERERGDEPGASARPHWSVTSAIVARTHVRRVLRQQAGSPWKLVVLAFLVLVFGTLTLGAAWFASVLGQGLASGDLDPSGRLPLFRGVAATVWLGATAMIAARAAGSRGARETTGGLLWAAPTRPLVAGLALAELAFLLLWLGLPALGVTAGLAFGLGSPLPVLTVGLAVVVLLALAAALGFPAGLAVRHVLTRFPAVQRYRTPLVLVAIVGYVLAVSEGLLNQLVAWLVGPLSVTPPGYVADLAALGIGGVQPSVTHAAVALAQVTLVWPAMLALTLVANRHWFADPVLVSEGDGDDSVEADSAASHAGSSGAAGGPPEVVASRTRLERSLGRVLGRPTAALVTLAYRRALRAPAKLLYAAMPFLFLLGSVVNVVRGGAVPANSPVILLLVVAWAAGVAFVLNPLGDQGSVLPATILSGVSGATFVRAHVLATLIVVLPAGVMAPTGAALLSPLDTQATLLVLAASPVVVTAGSLAGVGIGTLAPRYSSVRVSGSTDAVVPSKVAFAGYTLYLLGTVCTLLLVASQSARVAVAFLIAGVVPVSVDPGAIQFAAGAASLALLLVPFVGYRYAVARFEAVTLDSASR